MGTAIFNDPHAPVRILHELEAALTERGFARFADAIGYAHRPPDAVTPAELYARAAHPLDTARPDEQREDAYP